MLPHHCSMFISFYFLLFVFFLSLPLCITVLLFNAFWIVKWNNISICTLRGGRRRWVKCGTVLFLTTGFDENNDFFRHFGPMSLPLHLQILTCNKAIYLMWKVCNKVSKKRMKNFVVKMPLKLPSPWWTRYTLL